MLSPADIAAQKGRLKSTTTVVTARDGSKLIEEKGGLKVELPQTEEEKAATRSALGCDEHAALRLELDAVLATTSRPESGEGQLRIVSWNVWFDRHKFDERMKVLMAESIGEAPDVICLQEVVPRLAEAVRSCEALCSRYDVSPFSISNYGCLLLARKSLAARFSQHDFPTLMGRRLLVAQLAPGAGSGVPAATPLAVATVHLESLGNGPIRREQLKLAHRVLQATGGAAVLCGDFNFDATRHWGEWRERGAERVQNFGPRSMPPGAAAPPAEAEAATASSRVGFRLPEREPLENAALPTLLPGYVDAWAALRPDELGYTFDGAANPHVRDREERMRYDRVLVSPGLEPTAVAMLGTEALLVPSDHFGLCVEVRAAGSQ